MSWYLLNELFTIAKTTLHIEVEHPYEYYKVFDVLRSDIDATLDVVLG